MRVVDVLALAAAPTFAVMAVATGISDAGALGMPCSPATSAVPLNGMAVMYLLMSAFHAGPWLRLALKPEPDCARPQAACAGASRDRPAAAR